MNTLINSDIRIKSVDFKEELIVVGLMDGRIISVPLIYYPRLFNAEKNKEKNGKYKVSAMVYIGPTLTKI